jgi:quercetin dioxygenase-like cupin family protein
MKKIEPQTSQGPADKFAGVVHPTMILSGVDPSRVRMGSVHFAPGAHTAWHSHAIGQYLYVIEGTAFVQERGGNKETLKAGETIYTAPGVEHWHGASPDSFMVHLAIWEAPGHGEFETTWLDHISDDDYAS